MIVDKTIAKMLLVPIIGLCLPAAVFFRKVPNAGLTATEKELISFSSQPVTLVKPRSGGGYAGLENPVKPPPAIKIVPVPVSPLNAAALSRQAGLPKLPEQPLSVSMIYSDGATKMAIINGHVLKEGSSLNNRKVLKIEKKRVLLQTTGKDLWLNID